MFKIPKFAKGGIITTPPTFYIGDTDKDSDTIAIPCCKPIDKYYVIYKRTKKARIKKKNAKKSWTLRLKKELEKAKTITITIGTETKSIEV